MNCRECIFDVFFFFRELSRHLWDLLGKDDLANKLYDAGGSVPQDAAVAAHLWCRVC